jgi:hypothetical protein
MANETHVVEDGVTTSFPAKAASRSSWLLGAVSFILGLGLGVIVIGPTPSSVEGPTDSDLVIPVSDPIVEVDDHESPGVTGAIPAFPDALVAVADTMGSAFKHLLWPLNGELRVMAIPGGQNVSLDASAIFFAVSDELPGLNGRLLSMGRFDIIEPVSSGVTSHVFHDAESGALGYTVLAEEGARLFSVRSNFEVNNVTFLDSPRAVVKAWGDWGWAIQDGEQIKLLTPDGAPKDTERGVALTSHPSGWVFVVEGDVIKLVSAGGGVSLVPTELAVGAVRHAAFSPDGEKVAICGDRGVEVVHVDDGRKQSLSGFPTSHVSWSSDSRYVLASSSAGVDVHDVDEGRSYPIFRTYAVKVAGAMALRSP